MGTSCVPAESCQVIEYIRDLDHPTVWRTCGREQGKVWVPENVDSTVESQFGRVFQLTKQDNLFKDCNHRLHKQAIKRHYGKNSMALQDPFEELKKNRRSRVSDFSTITTLHIRSYIHDSI